MKNKSILVWTILLAVLLLSACSGYNQAGPVSQGANSTPERHISVTGTGQVYLSPDIANINIGVRTQSDDAAEALSENNQKAEAIHQKLIDMGVEQKDIQTSNLNVYPQQQYDPEGNVSSITYNAENSVIITVRNLDNLGEILNEAIQAGANSINNINFDVENREEALSKARTMAIEDAHHQAQELAEAAGIKLGNAMIINTASSDVISPLYSAKRASGVVMDEAAAVPVSAGQMVVSIQADVVYGIQ